MTDPDQEPLVKPPVGTSAHLSRMQSRAWTGFVDASRMLDERLESHLIDDFAMTHREYEVLVRIDGNGGAIRMTELAMQMVASQPLITQTITRLNKRGWVQRRQAKDDRRGVEAALTDEGSAVLKASARPHAELVEQLLLQHLGEDALADFQRAITRVADHLRAHRRHISCDDPGCPLNP